MEIIKIRTGKIKIEYRKTIINKQWNCCILEKINKIKKPLARLRKQQEIPQINKIKNKIGRY